WFVLKGKGSNGTFNGPIESLLGLPFDHPVMYLLIEIYAATRKKLQANTLFTLSDIFEQYEPTGPALSHDDPLLQPFVLAFGQRRVNLHPYVVFKLLNYPLNPKRCAVWAYAQLDCIPLEVYTPRLGRLTASSTAVVPIRPVRT
ncbi:hypothetical protein LPJ71_002579, partial [Coemansia sp. S17]